MASKDKLVPLKHDGTVVKGYISKFLIFKIYFRFVCIGVLHVCMSVQHVWAVPAHRPREGVGSLLTRIIDSML